MFFTSKSFNISSSNFANYEKCDVAECMTKSVDAFPTNIKQLLFISWYFHFVGLSVCGRPMGLLVCGSNVHAGTQAEYAVCYAYIIKQLIFRTHLWWFVDTFVVMGGSGWGCLLGRVCVQQLGYLYVQFISMQVVLTNDLEACVCIWVLLYVRVRGCV